MHNPNCAIVRQGNARAWCDCGFDRPFNPPMPIAQAIIGWFGERCSEYKQGCMTCEAWQQYDELNANYIAPAMIDIARSHGEQSGASMERRRLHDLLEQLLEAGIRPKAANLIRKELDAWREPDDEDE